MQGELALVVGPGGPGCPCVGIGAEFAFGIDLGASGIFHQHDGVGGAVEALGDIGVGIVGEHATPVAIGDGERNQAHGVGADACDLDVVHDLVIAGGGVDIAVDCRVTGGRIIGSASRRRGALEGFHPVLVDGLHVGMVPVSAVGAGGSGVLLDQGIVSFEQVVLLDKWQQEDQHRAV